jgi:tRNA1Val (adenine37-N6)-methyltransferase
MKVGTDAVLIGAWANVENAKRILEIGTGSGVIALMMAQRSSADATIDALEPEPSSAAEAGENVARSPWAQKVTVQQCAVQEFISPTRYDLIITNPPFFNKSQLPPKPTRINARHTETLSYDDLLTAVARLLTEDGTLAIILPTVEGNEFRQLAVNYGLQCHRSTAFFSRVGKVQERWLMEFSRARTLEGSLVLTPARPELSVGGDGTEVVASRLVLHGEGESWSEQYKELTKEFYL